SPCSPEDPKNENDEAADRASTCSRDVGPPVAIRHHVPLTFQLPFSIQLRELVLKFQFLKPRLEGWIRQLVWSERASFGSVDTRLIWCPELRTTGRAHKNALEMIEEMNP